MAWLTFKVSERVQQQMSLQTEPHPKFNELVPCCVVRRELTILKLINHLQAKAEKERFFGLQQRINDVIIFANGQRTRLQSLVKRRSSQIERAKNEAEKTKERLSHNVALEQDKQRRKNQQQAAAASIRLKEYRLCEVPILLSQATPRVRTIDNTFKLCSRDEEWMP